MIKQIVLFTYPTDRTDIALLILRKVCFSRLAIKKSVK